MTNVIAADVWRQLRQGGLTSTGDEVPSVPTAVAADAGVVRLALGPSGEGRLLLPLGTSDRLPVIAETPALRIIDASWTLDGRLHRFLDLTCVVRDLDNVFADVAGEIVRRISEGHGAISACVEVLDEFRLLLVPREERADVDAITGLVGELILLDRLLDLSPDAVSLWRGPLGERHDFRAGLLAIEVKTTGRAGNEMMRVGSLDQLLEPAGGDLSLARFTLEQAERGSLSVRALHERVLPKVGDPVAFRDRLARVGCPDPGSPDWNAAKFELQEERFYRVDEQFPRIIAASFAGQAMPVGTSALEYEVNLAIAGASRMTVDEAEAFLARMIKCP